MVLPSGRARQAAGWGDSPGMFAGLRAGFSFPQVPDASSLSSDLICQFGEPYLRRFFVLGSSRGSSARYHEILASDRADLHDHPWDFVSVILSGSYVETTPTGEQEYGPGSVLVRTAEQLHRLTLPSGPVWTFVVTSAARRRWGFQTDDGWVHWSDYLGRG